MNQAALSTVVRYVCTKTAAFVPLSFLKEVSYARWRHPWLKRWLEWGAEMLRNQDGKITHGAGKGLLFNTGR